MIVPMKKCLIAMLAAEKDEGLAALRRQGLVHTEEVSGSGEILESAKADRESLERAISALSMRKPPKGAKPGAADEGDPAATATRMAELAAEERSLLERMASLKKECDRVAVWGDFSPVDLASFLACGRQARLHALPAATPAAFPEGVDAISLGVRKKTEYFVSFSPLNETTDAMPDSVSLPDSGLGDMRREISSIEERLSLMNAERDGLVAFLPKMKKALEGARQRERFENLRSGLGSDGPIAYLSGWIPEPDLPALTALAARRCWALADSDPADDEMPPTKVKNNRVVGIIQPIFDFLGTMPGYREYEISALFLIFFSIFFAMIFGDAGYGGILLTVGIVAAIGAKLKGKKVPVAVKLLLYLSSMTVAWGAITVSWFSIDPRYLPDFLKLFAVFPIANTNPDSKAVGDNIKLLCFVLGAFQLSIAHIKNLIRDFKSPKMLAQIGSLLEVVGLFWLVLYLVISPEHYPLPNYSVPCIAVGFGLVFVFGNWTGKLLGSILESLKNIISIFLGTVSFMADIISYIRLWAVGLAGVAISQTVNGMGGGMLAGHGWLRVVLACTAMPLLFLIGHGLNMTMSTLSVVVHGVRLNLLEFSGHLGMEWSGYKYDPFRESAEDGD